MSEFEVKKVVQYARWKYGLLVLFHLNFALTMQNAINFCQEYLYT